MTLKRQSVIPPARLLAVVGGLIFMANCGGSSSTSITTTPPPPTTNNSVDLAVNLGPTDDYINGLFASVEVCEPGSTTNCATVPNVLVDTGSYGLRLLSGAVSGLTLPAVTDSGGNAVQECIGFVSLAYIWGPVVQADVHLSGETASSASIHIISETPQYPVPSSCIPTGPVGTPEALNSVSTLGANGILGVGGFPQDCGSLCTDTSTAPASVLFLPERQLQHYGRAQNRHQGPGLEPRGAIFHGQ